MVAADELQFASVALADLRPPYEVGVDPRSGGVSLRIDLPLTRGRRDFGPALSLSPGDDELGGVFGFGMALSGLSWIGIDTRDGLPRYDGTDRFTWAGQELVPTEVEGRTRWERSWAGVTYTVEAFRLRIETSPVRVERWTSLSDGHVHFRVREADGSVGIYGARLDGSTRVADPSRPERVWRFLLEARHDAFGNAWFVDYVSEDDRGAGADEMRFAGAGAGRYVKRIVYGNRSPLAEGERADLDQFAFHVVFDHGDHADDGPEPGPAWPVRPDPFSTGRPGFPLRTRRLCRRVLLFHRFPAALGEDATLVRSVELEHDGAVTGSRLRAVRFTGMRGGRGGRGERREQPVLRLRHRAYRLGSAEDEVSIAAESAFSPATRVLDLFGEGLPGLLTITGNAILYAENLGGGRFGARRALAERPTGAGAAFDPADFDGDGNLEVMTFVAGRAGFFRLERESGAWEPFRALPVAPRADARALRMQRVDIDGDGRADLVLFDDTGFTWFASRGEDGFTDPVHVSVAAEHAPFENLLVHRFFADMTGDGLVDLVEIQNGSVRYFPSLGRGRFGDPVEMLDAPRLDHDGAFDPSRVRLLDLDGSGAADLLYLGCGDLRVYRNARGARFLPEERMSLPSSPYVAGARIEDLLGEGTPCLVWFTSGMDGSAGVRAIRLLPDGPPGLLDGIEDGLGQQIRFEHRSSALEYRRDVDEGRGWLTRLPSHTQVVTRMELVDLVAGHRQGRTYRYHDGHFDGLERQFVGFLHVDEIDVLDPDASLVTVPTLTRHFHHAGDDRRRGAAFAFDADPRGPPLRMSVAELTWRERDHALALRALAGQVVRTEIATYGRPAPHVVREASAHAVLLRSADAAFPRGAFRVHALETREITLEHAPGDARVTRGLSLVHDDHGFVRMSAEIGRGRELPGIEGQNGDRGTARVVTRLVHIDALRRFELGLPVEESAYELLASVSRLPLEAARDAVQAAIAQADGTATGDGELARLLARSRTLYWNDDRSAPLPLEEVGAPALPHHQRQAAFSHAQIERLFATFGDVERLARDAAYERDTAFWWRSSPIQHFLGRAQFFMPASTERPGSAARQLEYDTPDFLALTAVVDELGNRTEATIDYHLLAPGRIEDANGFVREVEYDALGVITRATAHGSVRGEGGSSAYGHAALDDTPLPTMAAALADPESALGGAQQIYLYDFGDPSTAQAPRALQVIAERFAGDEPRAQVALGYLDGFGRSLQEKTRVEPGHAFARAPDGSIELDGGVPVRRRTDMRWRASGFRTYDEKGQLLREHEPFFTALAELELDPELRHLGAATTLRHDALGRVVREEYADGSFSRVEPEPWRVQRFDANDTVHEEGAARYRSAREALPGGDPRRLALARALEHRDTPSTSYLDPFGRVLATEELADDRRPLRSRSDLDGRGDPVRLVDPRGIEAFVYERDLLGRVLRERSADAGERLTFIDAFDRPVFQRNARGVVRELRFDALDRPIASYVEHEGRRWLAEHSEYGESSPDGRERNARGRLLLHRDAAGLVEIGDYDPFGNVLVRSRRLTSQVAEPDWDGDVLLDAPHESRFSYDALGRVLRARLPDGVERTTHYLRGSGIESVTAVADGREHPILSSARFNARGQRTRLVLGNGVRVRSDHDPETFRLQRLRAVRLRGEERQVLSSALHTYDPTGRLVHFVDEAQEPGRSLVLAGQRVGSERTFRYDFRYQLAAATGRVHRALSEFEPQVPRTHDGFRGTRRAGLADGGQISRYLRSYRYDDGGNLVFIEHGPADGHPGARFNVDKWVSERNNRSLLRLRPDGTEVAVPESHFDANGNALDIEGVHRIEWNAHDRLSRAVIHERPGGTDDDERYQYGSDCQRVRKVERRVGHGDVVTTTETLYLDGCELKRVWLGDRLILQRFVSHFQDEDGSKVASLYRWERDTNFRETDAPSSPRLHFTLSDSRGSAVLELDAEANVLAYEEYFPYGRTAFVAGDIREVALRTIRYSGKEQDDVTGLYYFQYRYYSPYVGNWLSPDPIAPEDSLNSYQYVLGDPINLRDEHGLCPERPCPARLVRVPAGLTPEQALERANREGAREGVRFGSVRREGDTWVAENPQPLGGAIGEEVAGQLRAAREASPIVLEPPGTAAEALQGIVPDGETGNGPGLGLGSPEGTVMPGDPRGAVAGPHAPAGEGSANPPPPDGEERVVGETNGPVPAAGVPGPMAQDGAPPQEPSIFDSGVRSAGAPPPGSGRDDWRMWVAIGIGIAVGIALTIATAGAFAAMAASMAGTLGVIGAAVVAGTLSGALAGFGAGVATELAAQLLYNEPIDAWEILAQGGIGALTGAATGGLTGGLMPSSVLAPAVSSLPAALQAGVRSQLAREAARSLATRLSLQAGIGALGGMGAEGTRQLVTGERDLGGILGAGVLGGGLSLGFGAGGAALRGAGTRLLSGAGGRLNPLNYRNVGVGVLGGTLQYSPGWLATSPRPPRGILTNVTGRSTGGFGLGRDRSVDRVAGEIEGSLQQADRILRAGGHLQTPWGKVYQATQGYVPSWLTRMFRGNALQQVTDRLLARNLYVQDAGVIFNRGSVLGLRGASGALLRPDYQVPLPGGSVAVLDMTTHSQAPKIAKYYGLSNLLGQPSPGGLTKALINITYQ